MQNLYIPIVLGTGREGRESEQVAHFMLEQMRAHGGIETELIDVRDYVKSSTTIPAWVEDERAAPWRAAAKKADGYLIVVPEYNHGYPGELKLLLDSAMKEYAKKPVALCAVSSGGFGGTRVVENLWPIVLELGMVPVMNPLYFSKVADTFNEDGSIKDDMTIKYANKLLDELCWFAGTLKAGKDPQGKTYSCGK